MSQRWTYWILAAIGSFGFIEADSHTAGNNLGGVDEPPC